MIKRIGYEAIGELCHKVMYGIDEKCSWCVHESVMKGEHVKTEIINPLDSKTYNISNSPIFHTDGSISKLTIYRDITAHRQVEEDYQMLFHKMLNGFALCEIICDTAGNPIDFRYLATNPAFENITGLKSEDIVGKTLLEIAPDTEHYWIEIFGKVALTGDPIFFENYTNVLGKHLELNTFRPGPNQFATVFADITDKKKWKTSFNNPRRWNP
ncbi:MAG: PAS domain-containing protein [Desulfobacterales bacterium]|nr:PAS domain-containing protein [Desulfobacterales bacterium]